jgi:hypothetical protein
MVAVTLASAGTLIFGCAHNNQGTANNPPPPPPPPYNQPVGATNPMPNGMDPAIVDRLASARCDREQSCDNVGDGKKFASRHVCMEQLRGSIGNDLNAYQCPSGINQSAVTYCVSAISAEECGAHPVETITRIDKCRSGAMCMK